MYPQDITKCKKRIKFRKSVLIGLSMEILQELYYSYLRLLFIFNIIIIIYFIVIIKRLFKVIKISPSPRHLQNALLDENLSRHQDFLNACLEDVLEKSCRSTNGYWDVSLPRNECAFDSNPEIKFHFYCYFKFFDINTKAIHCSFNITNYLSNLSTRI